MRTPTTTMSVNLFGLTLPSLITFQSQFQELFTGQIYTHICNVTRNLYYCCLLDDTYLNIIIFCGHISIESLVDIFAQSIISGGHLILHSNITMT